MVGIVPAPTPRHALPPLEAQVAPVPPLRPAPPILSAAKLEVTSFVKRLTCGVCHALKEPLSYPLCHEIEHCLVCAVYRSSCTSPCYSCLSGTWQPDPIGSYCDFSCTGGCCCSCIGLRWSTLGDQSIAVVSSSAVTGATTFSQSCLCAAGYYFVSANDKWGSSNTTGTGANKDYLLPCQPCSSGTYKTGNNLLGPSACTPCSLLPMQIVCHLQTNSPRARAFRQVALLGRCRHFSNELLCLFMMSFFYQTSTLAFKGLAAQIHSVTLHK